MAFDRAKFEGKIADGTIHVGVLGLGYVGLPLALTFVERAGIRVTGFDIDGEKIDLIARGESYIAHVASDRLRGEAARRLFSATTDFSRLPQPDALIIAVPTPLTRQREPDLRYVEETARAIAANLRVGQLVVLESTTYPGTTDGPLREILEASGLRSGEDFLLAFSPEREDPGNRSFSTATIPKVVGGVDPVATDLAAALYARAIDKVVKVASARTAEAAKLTENIFRAANIALINELKVIYERMGIDIWEVLDAASSKPFGFMRFNPGPGIGGHCIPLDPFYLTWKAREYGLATRFIELAGEINLSMPRYVVEKLRDALDSRGKPLRKSRILVLGLAYKKDVGDSRESPSFEIIELLLHHGAAVSYHDPFIAAAPLMRSWPNLPPLRSVPLTAATLKSTDAVIIATDHTQVDYDLVVRTAPLVVDTRGVFRAPRDNVVKA